MVFIDFLISKGQGSGNMKKYFEKIKDLIDKVGGLRWVLIGAFITCHFTSKNYLERVIRDYNNSKDGIKDIDDLILQFEGLLKQAYSLSINYVGTENTPYKVPQFIAVGTLKAKFSKIYIVINRIARIHDILYLIAIIYFLMGIKKDGNDEKFLSRLFRANKECFIIPLFMNRKELEIHLQELETMANKDLAKIKFNMYGTPREEQ